MVYTPSPGRAVRRRDASGREPREGLSSLSPPVQVAFRDKGKAPRSSVTPSTSAKRVECPPPPRRSGAKGEKRGPPAPLAGSPVKRAPPPPVAEDPFQLILREMQRISQRVGELEAGAKAKGTASGQPPPASAVSETYSVDGFPSEGDVAPSASGLSCSHSAQSPPPAPPSPRGRALPALEWEGDSEEAELQLHPSESSDGSLYSPRDGDTPREMDWEEPHEVVPESSLLADVRAAACEIGLISPSETAAQAQAGQGIWAGVPLSKGDPPFPVADGYSAMLRRSWDAVVPTDRWNPGCGSLRRLRYDPDAGLECMPPVEREVAEFTPIPPSKLDADPVHPDREGRAADRLVSRAFDAAMRAARVGNLLAISLASARRQAEDVSPRLAATLTSALTLQSQVVRDLGESLGTTIRARRHLWLRATSLPVTARERLISLPVEPGRVFNSASRALLESLGEARKARNKVVEALVGAKPKAPPRRGSGSAARASRSVPPAPPTPRPDWGSAKQSFRGRKAKRGRGGKSRGGRTGS